MPTSAKVARLRPPPIETEAPEFPEGDVEAIIEKAAGIGLRPDQIAYLLGMKVKDVLGFTDAFDRGKAKADFKVANALFTTAVDRNHKSHATCAIYWTKARMGWAEAATPKPDDTPDAPVPVGEEDIGERFEATMKALRGED